MTRKPIPTTPNPAQPGKPHGGRRGHGPGGRAAGGGSGVWLAGTHAVAAALANPERTVLRLVATTEAARAIESALYRSRQQRSIPDIEPMARPDIDRLVPPGTVHQGLCALVEPLPGLDISELIAAAEGRTDALIVVLDQVTDPHNVGAVLRSAAAFGALGLVVTDRHAPDETCTLAKAASGALEHIPLVRVTNLARALDDLKKGGFWICGLAADAPQTLAGANLSGKIALALGAEGEGLRRLTREACDHMVKLPMTGAVESLNVSNAAAIALYEFARLR